VPAQASGVATPTVLLTLKAAHEKRKDTADNLTAMNP
jgi:hypothetical protein